MITRVEQFRERVGSAASIAWIAWVASGCAEPQRTAIDVQESVVGDTTVVHTVSGQGWNGAAVLREELTIGALDGPPELTFGEITRMAEDGAGGVYLFDGQAVQIRHYDARGDHLRDVGRSGEGPGEYQNLTLGMAVGPTGVLYLHDWGNDRIARFDREGVPLDAWPMGSRYLSTVPGRWVFADGVGRLLVAARVDDAMALVATADGEVSDTLLVPRLPGMPAQRGGPYRIDTYWSRTPEGCWVVGVSDTYSFDVRCADGVRRVRRTVDPLPVHPEEAAEYRARFEWMEAQPLYQAPQGEWIPAAMPPFSGLDVGSDGRIWVRRNTQPIRVAAPELPDGQPMVTWAQPFLYDVFGADGVFLGEVRFPDDVQPHLFGSDSVWGVRTGSLGEQYVVRLALEVE